MVKHVGEDGSVKTDGRQNLLKQSGFYPRALGISIVQAWQRRRAWQPPIRKVQGTRAMAKIEDPWSDPWGDSAWGDAGPPKRQRASKATVEDDPWGEQSTSADDPWADMLGWWVAQELLHLLCNGMQLFTCRVVGSSGVVE